MRVSTSIFEKGAATNDLQLLWVLYAYDGPAGSTESIVSMMISIRFVILVYLSWGKLFLPNPTPTLPGAQWARGGGRLLPFLACGEGSQRDPGGWGVLLASCQPHPNPPRHRGWGVSSFTIRLLDNFSLIQLVPRR